MELNPVSIRHRSRQGRVLRCALARNTINSSYTPNLYAYSLATSNQQYGYAAAVSFVLGVVIAGASYIFTLIANRRRPEQ